MEKWYVWLRVHINDNFYKDPNTIDNHPEVTVIETGLQIDDDLFLAKLIGTEQDILDYIEECQDFQFTAITNENILGCLEYYYSDYKIKDGKTDMFEIVDNEIIDNRDLEEVI